MGFCQPGDVVVPGDIVKDKAIDEASNENKMGLGPGLKRQGDTVVVSRAGILRKEKRFLLVDSHQRRYIPVRGEKVIGIIVKKMGDFFQVDIGASDYGILSYLVFENASKKNRPNIEPGDIVFCTLITACPDMEPELICVNAAGKSDGLGLLPSNDSLLFFTSLHLIRKITNPKNNIFKALERKFGQFEFCIGSNGRIWLRALDSRKLVSMADTILSLENIQTADVNALCRKIAQEKWK